MKKQYARGYDDLTSSEKGSLTEVLSKEIFFERPYSVRPYSVSSTKKSEKLSIDELAKLLLLPLRLKPGFILGTVSRNQLHELVPNRFAVSSIINVTSIRIDGKDILTDTPLSDPRFSMSVYFAYGSCPYLMVYDSEKGYWKELGTVITDRKSVELKGDEIHKLGDSSSKIRIEERDNEITYLDSVSILYTDSVTGAQGERQLAISSLGSNDGKYYILHPGQSLDIDLKSLLPKNSINISLKVNGYYQILDKNSMHGI